MIAFSKDGLILGFFGGLGDREFLTVLGFVNMFHFADLLVSLMFTK